MAYRVPPKTGPRRLAAIQSTLNQINWESRVVQYEMDTEDGEIRLAIDFPVEDGKASRQHTRVRMRGGLWFVDDMGSRNGTFVDNTRAQAEPLHHPDFEHLAIRIGE